MTKRLTPQAKLYLNEIAERLWSNKAAVMVGAGLSQNAEPVGPGLGALPSWKQLGNSFHRKLHGQTSGKDARYLSVLKLAEQVEAAFGRPALNDLLRREIRDLRYEPSALHGELLGLPWKDIFTTNYDTLLERARAKVTLMHYDVVATKEDLLYASGPRIVKLHGSFPSPPFVITEEDYRRYPSDHAPFVNTVRQSLLENTLCLLGFSGDDPNFLQWIGWIRDHVGRENAPKIYLIGALNELSEPDSRLLDGRGIVAVDLSAFGDHKSALQAFVEHLRSRRTTALDWPLPGAEAPPKQGEGRPKRYRKVVDEWRRQRMAYPGWIVPPADRRDALWDHTEKWLLHVRRMSPEEWARLGAPLDLELVHELGWRLDRSLVPLEDDLAELLGELAGKYGDGPPASQKGAGQSSATVFDAVANVRIWLMRYYREEGQNEQWDKTREAMAANFASLLPEQRARFRLEEVLQSLFRFDPATAKSLLVDWEAEEHLPFWEARRAAMLAELGDTVTARSMLASCLQEIRKQVGHNPVTDDYTLVSQESIAMVLHHAVERSAGFMEREPTDKELTQEFNERWKVLARYKCDPRRDLDESFAAMLRHADSGENMTRHQFDLGMVTHTMQFGTDMATLAAYRLLRLREDIGMPYRIGNVTFVGAAVKATLPSVGRVWPHWALVNIVRLGDAKAADEVFDREFLATLGREQIDGLFERYIVAFERTVDMVDDSDWTEARTFESLAKTLPEVFSRLCNKCSPRNRERLVAVLGRIYGSRRRQVYREVGRLAQRVLGSMSSDERVRAIPALLEFPVPKGLRQYEIQHFANPVALLDLPSSVSGKSIPVAPERIDRLLDQLSGQSPGRDWAATTLAWLHGRRVLTARQADRLGDLLWAGVDKGELPVVPWFQSVDCMTLPHPSAIDPEPRVKEHLRSGAARRLEDNVIDELRRSARVIEWSPLEVLELVAMLSKWCKEKKPMLQYEMDMPDSPADETRSTAWKIVGALSALVPPVSGGDEGDDVAMSLRDFVAELKAHGIPVSRLEVESRGLLTENRQVVLDRISTAMLSNEPDIVHDALAAAWLLAEQLDESAHSEFDLVATRLAQGIQWRYGVMLAGRLRCAADLVDRHPWSLTEEMRSALLEGLAEIAKETSTGIKANDVDGVIDKRSAAAALASVLSRHYEASAANPPKIIEDWQRLCSAPDEFAEVRNAWMATEPPSGRQ